MKDLSIGYATFAGVALRTLREMEFGAIVISSEGIVISINRQSNPIIHPDRSSGLCILALSARKIDDVDSARKK